MIQRAGVLLSAGVTMCLILDAGTGASAASCSGARAAEIRGDLLDTINHIDFGKSPRPDWVVDRMVRYRGQLEDLGCDPDSLDAFKVRSSATNDTSVAVGRCSIPSAASIEADLADTVAHADFRKSPQPAWIVGRMVRYRGQLRALGCDTSNVSAYERTQPVAGSGNNAADTPGACTAPGAAEIEADIADTMAHTDFGKTPQPDWIVNRMIRYRDQLAALDCSASAVADSSNEDDASGGGGVGGGTASACSLPDARNTKLIYNGGMLESALRNAACGDHIVLAGGQYRGSFNLSRSCPPGEPVVVRGVDRNAEITSRLKLGGSNNIVTDVTFTGPSTGVDLSGTGNSVRRSVFTNWTNKAIDLRSGKRGSVEYNEFFRPHSWGHSSDGDYPLRIAIRSSDKPTTFHSDAIIRRNYFHDFPAKPDPREYHSGQSDAIEICYTGSLKQSGFLIEYNLVERHHGGHGVIDMKCGGATVQFNTLVDSPGGRIDLRNGRNTTLRANWVENAGGTRTHGFDHTIIGSVYRNTSEGISIAGGNAHWTAEKALTPQSYNIEIIENDANIVRVGISGRGYTRPAVGTLIVGDQGSSPRLMDQTGTRFIAYRGGHVPKATRLAPSQVGINAPCGN